MELTEPKVIPTLDESFRPAVLANRNFQRDAQPIGQRLVIGLERGSGEFSRFETLVYPEGHPSFESNYPYVERLVKFLLWQRGGHTLYVGGPSQIGDYVGNAYSANGVQ